MFCRKIGPKKGFLNARRIYSRFHDVSDDCNASHSKGAELSLGEEEHILKRI